MRLKPRLIVQQAGFLYRKVPCQTCAAGAREWPVVKMDGFAVLVRLITFGNRKFLSESEDRLPSVQEMLPSAHIRRR